MTMLSFGVLSPDVADRECRTPQVRQPWFGKARSSLPADDYALLEAYCIDPECDCRRVILNVVSRRGERIEATIGFGFDRDVEDAGPYLDPLNPQREHADEILELTEEVLLADEEYVARLERHYHLVKAAVNDPEHPIHDRIPPLSDDASEPPVEPIVRSSAKIGRNSRCPCGSGKKYKRCCAAAKC